MFLAQIHLKRSVLVIFCFYLFFNSCSGTTPKKGSDLFLSLFRASDYSEQQAIIEKIADTWISEYEILTIETLYLLQDPRVSFELRAVFEEKTGKDYGYDFNEWYFDLWNEPPNVPSDYHAFKAELYKLVDPKFEKYFRGREHQTTIRLDEVRWGGVRQDGIPPLRNPPMIKAAKAEYLDESNIVFGIAVNGDVRAYPKRILAWHEMFVDEVGGIPVAGVYCTLCGTVILYETQIDGKNYELGTSGFLYRSNKLMYDKATQSLWNTMQGTPVIGPLVEKEITLNHLSVVTTTWGEWKKRHPNTLVLSIETGYQRNYDEGVAYREYFLTDELMFNTPFKSGKLKNKEEVLALRFTDTPYEQLAISVEFLKQNPIYFDQVGHHKLVVITDNSGANRVYEHNGQQFEEYDGYKKLIDEEGNVWQVLEEHLKGPNGEKLARLPYYRAFWFGWHAAYPQTRLVK